MQNTTDTQFNLMKKLTHVCTNLRPFQSFEYDPEGGQISLVTEWLIPSDGVNQLRDLIAGRKADEKISIRRFDRSFKLAIVKSIQL